MLTTETNERNRERRERTGSACTPLLEAATRDLFHDNAFRITGLTMDATMREITKHVEELRMLEEFGEGKSAHTAAFARKPPPTVEEIREALHRLKDPEKRIIDEFFWFWPQEPGRRRSDPALQALARGEVDSALQIWTSQEQEHVCGAVASHNLAVAYWVAALDWECCVSRGQTNERQQEEMAAYLQAGYSRWRRIRDDDHIWDQVAERIRQMGDPRLKPAFVGSMRATLPLALAKICAELALTHAEKGRMSLARMHIELLREGGEEAASFVKAAELVLTPVTSRLREHIRRTKETAHEKPEAAASAVRDLLAQAIPFVAILDLFYGEAEHVGKEVLDELATACIDCLVSHQKKTGDNHAFVELLQMTLPLADAVDVRQRIEKNIQIGRDNLAYVQVEPIRNICEAASKAAEANPASADEQADRILSAASGMLPKLSGSGVPNEILDRAHDEVALAAMHCAVLFGNKTEKWKPCIRILEQSLRLAVSLDAQRRIRENLATVRTRSALYDDLTPISSAPSLSTVNGIGFTLYGCTDHDPATDSYLATYYFVLFFVPIFPICRYRVARSANSYRFFGKAALRTCDKWHIAVSIAVIIAAVFAMGSSSSSTSPSPSSYTSPNYNYTPVPATPAPSAPAYDTERAEIQAERTRLQELENQIEQLGREIDSDRIYLDRTSQYAVDAFNEKVGRYNALVQHAKAANGAFNERVHNYNAGVRR
jgi:hypothetical protein